jgi:sensor histidine kinase YesM
MPEKKSYLARTPQIILFCLAGAAVMTYAMCPACRTSGETFGSVAFFSFVSWFILWMGNGLIAQYLERRISWVDFPVRRLVVGIVTTVGYSTVVILALLQIWESVFHMSFGNYYSIVFYSLGITFSICLILYSRAFLRSWKESAINAEKFQKASIQAQYDSLKSQVNPHFLFNSLNALTNLVYEDRDRAVKFIKQLSDVYRYVLDTRHLEVVSLDAELKFLRSYIYLQEIRFDQGLKVEIDLPREDYRVAPLALQLLIENAIKHNVVSKDDPLTIRVYEKEGFIVVENNIQRKSSVDEDGNGIGLENIRQRYSFLSDRKVSVVEADGRFVVKLPVLTVS